MNAVIDVQQIQFQYPGSNDLVLDIDHFQAQKGEKIFLYGPSGTGKSTFLEILAGVLVVQRGQVQILGHDLSVMSSDQRDALRGSHIGYIFQSLNLLPFLSIRENIMLPLELSPERARRVEKPENELQYLLDKLGLAGFQYKPVHQLSVGQQQRVAVARALIGSPELILADEPTSALDYDHRERFLQLLFDLAEENQSSVLFVSHDRTLEKMFDRRMSLSEINKVRG